MVIMCVKPAFTHISAISLSEMLPRLRIFVCWLYGRHGNTPEDKHNLNQETECTLAVAVVQQRWYAQSG
jgi:hypothetical protein